MSKAAAALDRFVAAARKGIVNNLIEKRAWDPNISDAVSQERRELDNRLAAPPALPADPRWRRLIEIDREREALHSLRSGYESMAGNDAPRQPGRPMWEPDYNSRGEPAGRYDRALDANTAVGERLRTLAAERASLTGTRPAAPASVPDPAAASTPAQLPPAAGPSRVEVSPHIAAWAKQLKATDAWRFAAPVLGWRNRPPIDPELAKILGPPRIDAPPQPAPPAPPAPAATMPGAPARDLPASIAAPVNRFPATTLPFPGRPAPILPSRGPSGPAYPGLDQTPTASAPQGFNWGPGLMGAAGGAALGLGLSRKRPLRGALIGGGLGLGAGLLAQHYLGKQGGIVIGEKRAAPFEIPRYTNLDPKQMLQRHVEDTHDRNWGNQLPTIRRSALYEAYSPKNQGRVEFIREPADLLASVRANREATDALNRSMALQARLQGREPPPEVPYFHPSSLSSRMPEPEVDRAHAQGTAPPTRDASPSGGQDGFIREPAEPASPAEPVPPEPPGMSQGFNWMPGALGAAGGAALGAGLDRKHRVRGALLGGGLGLGAGLLAQHYLGKQGSIIRASLFPWATSTARLANTFGKMGNAHSFIGTPMGDALQSMRALGPPPVPPVMQPRGPGASGPISSPALAHRPLFSARAALQGKPLLPGVTGPNGLLGHPRGTIAPPGTGGVSMTSPAHKIAVIVNNRTKHADAGSVARNVLGGLRAAGRYGMGGINRAGNALRGAAYGAGGALATGASGLGYQLPVEAGYQLGLASPQTREHARAMTNSLGYGMGAGVADVLKAVTPAGNYGSNSAITRMNQGRYAQFAQTPPNSTVLGMSPHAQSWVTSGADLTANVAANLAGGGAAARGVTAAGRALGGIPALSRAAPYAGRLPGADRVARLGRGVAGFADTMGGPAWQGVRTGTPAAVRYGRDAAVGYGAYRAQDALTQGAREGFAAGDLPAAAVVRGQ